MSIIILPFYYLKIFRIIGEQKMREKIFLNTVRFQAVIPAEIKIRVYRNLFESKAFDKDGQPVFLYEKSEPRFRNDDNYDLFTDELYTELLSIENTKDADDFIIKYPSYCIAFPDDFGREYKPELINKSRYLSLMLSCLREFKTSKTTYKDVYDMLNEPDNMDAIIKAVYALTCKVHLIINHRVHSELRDWLQNPIPVSPDFESRIKVAVGSFQRQIERITNTIELASLFKPSVEFRCPSLITAMYQKLIISAYNNEEYRQCANKHCTNYFKLGNRTTQKYCEKHLEVRRRKQKNYIEKQKQEL